MSSSLSIVITSGLGVGALNAENRFVEMGSIGLGGGGCWTGFGGGGCSTGLGGESFLCVVEANEDPVPKGLAADVVTGNELPCPIPPDTPVFPPILPAPNVNGFVMSAPNTGLTVSIFPISGPAPPAGNVDFTGCTLFSVAEPKEYTALPSCNPLSTPLILCLSSSLAAIVAGESSTPKMVSAVLLGVPRVTRESEKACDGGN